MLVAPAPAIVGPRAVVATVASWLCCGAQSSKPSFGFTMPQRLRECELAMTIILTFYDNSDVCRIS